MFAALRCRWGVRVCDVQAIIECRLSGRTSLGGTMGSNPFSSTDESYKPDHSDRSSADEQLGKPGISVDRGKRKYHHS